MYIIMIASECAPVIKAGGLADVVFGLSRELEIRGNSVEIILPKYDCMRYDQIWELQICFQDLWVPWYGGAIHCSVWFGFVHGRKCFFIDPHSQDNFFSRRICYGAPDDAMRFAFFSKAALEFMLKSNKRPDIIHAHDWHTGLVPVLLYEIYQSNGMPDQRICYTIHNFKHQGVAGADVLHATGLNRPEYYFHYNRLRDNFNASAINFMKGGIVYSNFVATVSPHHAWEARFTGLGYGLGHTLQIHQGKFGGVLNGVDYTIWNPEIDPHIPSHYGIRNIQEKYRNKEALRNRLWLRHDYKPLIAYIGRLDTQKGVDLIRHALFYSIGNSAQFVLLGSSPENDINNYFWHLKHYLNSNPDSHLEIGFNEDLSHLIYAGADMIIVPSNFEPCGLTQMIGLKYGTVPIVRAVGGLMDTVFDKDYHHDKPLHERNGFVFHHADYKGIESALHRAIRLWYDYPDHFRNLMLNGMRYDYSWNYPGQQYLDIYNYIRHR
jgi:starch synthase